MLNVRTNKNGHAISVALGGAFAVLLAGYLAFAFTPSVSYADEPLIAAGVEQTRSASDTFTVSLNVTYGQSEARSMLDMINAFRTGDDAWEWDSNNQQQILHTDLSELSYDYELERVAMQRAAEIALSFDHLRPDGATYSYAMLSSYRAWGENIAAGNATASATFVQWQETNKPYSGQGHRRAMLSSEFTHVGIGHAVCNGTHYWVQVFSKPALDETPTEAVNSQQTVDIVVANSQVASSNISVAPPSIEMTIGQSASLPSLQASIRLTEAWPARSTTVGVSAPSWSSTDSSVAAVEGNSLVAKSVGSTTLTTANPLGGDTAITVPVVVRKPNLSNAVITLTPNEYTYNGSEKRPSVTVTLDSVTLTGDDYDVAYSNNVNAGEATVTVTGKGNYEGQATASFTINRMSINVPTAAEGLTYNGTEQTGVAAGAGYSVTGGSATNAGSHTATATLNDSANCQWEDGTTAAKQITWLISRKAVIVTSNNAQKTYGEADPEFTASVDGLIGNDTVSYTLTRESGENAGVYTITPSGNAEQGNYYVTFKADGKLTIAKASSSISLGNDTQEYNGEEVKYAGQISRSGSTGDVTISYFSDQLCETPVGESDVKNAGTYYVRATLAADANHDGATSNVATLVVTSKAVTVTANDAGKVYGQGDPELTATVVGLVGSDTVTYTLTRAEGESVAEYAITASGEEDQGNYHVTFVGANFTITVAEATVTPNILHKEYGDVDPKLTAEVTGLANGDDPSVIAYTLTREVGENVGEYPVTATGAELQGNYHVTYVQNKVFCITWATATVKAERKQKTYGDADPELTWIAEGLKFNDDKSVLSVWINRHEGETVGNYQINVGGDLHQGNYTVIYASDWLMITQKDATIQPDDKRKIAGQQDPKLTATIEGLVNGDDPSVIAYKLKRVAGEDVGEYDIFPEAEQSQGNYNVILGVGKLTILNEQTSVTPPTPASNLIYNGKEQVGVAASGEGYTVTGGTANQAGTYTVIATLGDGYMWDDKTLDPKQISFTIAQKDITVKVDDKSKAYGEQDPILTVSIDGILDGDDFTPSYRLYRDAGEDVGTYNITIICAGNQGNYSISKAGGIFTIVKANQVITATDVNKAFGDAAFDLGAKLKVGDGTLTYASDNERVAKIDDAGKVTIVGVGSATITVKSAETANYNAASKNVAINVVKATIAVPKAKSGLVYNGKAQTGVAAGTGFTVKGGSATNAGSYAATVTADANHVFPGGKATVSVKWSIAKATVAVPKAKSGLVYNGKVQTGVAAGAGFTVKGGSATNAGSYTATATADANHVFPGGKATVSVKWSIAKAKATVAFKAVKKTLTVGVGKSLAASKTFKVTKNTSKGAVTYKKVKGDKKITITKNGKIKVKKGLAGGVYTIKVKATSAATANYSAATSKVVTFKVKVQ